MMPAEISPGKIMPQAVDIEEIVLGALLVDSEAIYVVAGVLNPDDFYLDSNALIYSACLRLQIDSNPIDLITVIAKLKELGTLNKVGGAVYLSGLTNKVGSAVNIEYHCKLIKQRSVRRKIIKATHRLQKQAFDDTKDPFETLNQSELEIGAIQNDLVKGRRMTHDQIMEKVIQMISTDKVGIHPSGITSVDRILWKLVPGNMMILGARPGMGKSMFANTVAKHIGIHLNKKVLFWGLEMTNEENMLRMISNVGRLKYNDLKKGKISIDRLQGPANIIKKSGLVFEDVSGVTAMDIRNRAVSMKRNEGLDFIIIDHGGWLKPIDTKKSNTADIISDTTKLLKQTAKDLDIPLLLLWQLSRDVEKRGGAKMPGLSDLRGSGSLEEDADIVTFLYRPEYYGMKEVQHRGKVYNSDRLGMLEVSKNRGDRLDTAIMAFNPNYCCFEDYDPMKDYGIENIQDDDVIPF